MWVLLSLVAFKGVQLRVLVDKTGGVCTSDDSFVLRQVGEELQNGETCVPVAKAFLREGSDLPKACVADVTRPLYSPQALPLYVQQWIA